MLRAEQNNLVTQTGPGTPMGQLFRSYWTPALLAEELPENALLEMVFEMPEEISGQKNSNVLCQGRIIRARDAQDGSEGAGMAASILDYKFLHQ